MNVDSLLNKAAEHLRELCTSKSGRCVGSQSNRAATSYFANNMELFSFAVEKPSFDCFSWKEEGATLLAGGKGFKLQVSPYSLHCNIQAPLCTVTHIDELKSTAGAGRIVLLKGEIAREQLMPKNFTFYNPVAHQEIIKCLENQGFIAVLAGTARNRESIGGVYPFPLIEDGDFTLPSAYMSEEEADRLAAYTGEKVFLHIKAQRTPARGYNVVARKGKEGKRIVFCAHIDSKEGTTGAIDNAAGVVTLLLLGELCRDYQGEIQIEIVALNGEDYYSNPGQMLYLEENRDSFSDILLGINIDGLGYHQGKTAYSLYRCPQELERTLQEVFSTHKEFVEGEPWYQGDHSLFLYQNRPAVAITSDPMDALLQITHTPADTVAVIHTDQLVRTAFVLRKLVEKLEPLAAQSIGSK